MHAIAHFEVRERDGRVAPPDEGVSRHLDESSVDYKLARFRVETVDPAFGFGRVV